MQAPKPLAQDVHSRRVFNTIGSISQLGNEGAQPGYPVHLRAQVTYVDSEWGMLFLTDATGSIYASIDPKAKARVGDILDVAGKTAAGAVAPIVAKATLKVIDHRALASPKRFELASLDSGVEDGAFVLTEGILRPGPSIWDHTSLLLVDGKTTVPILIPGGNPKALSMIGAKVLVRATCGAHLDSDNRRLGAELYVESLDDIQIEDPNWKNIFDTPIVPIKQVEGIEVADRFVPAVHIRGTVLWSGEGAVVLGDSSGSVYVDSSVKTGADQGAVLEVIGFPELRGDSALIADAAVRLLGAGHPSDSPYISRSSAEVLRFGKDGDAVQMTGKLTSQEVRGKEEIFTLDDHGTGIEVLVTATTPGSSLVTLTPGSLLQVSGTLRIVHHRNGAADSIQLLVDRPSRVVVKNVSGINWRLLLSVLVAFTASAVLLWIIQLRRALRSNTRLIRKQLEHETKLENRYRRLFERNLAAVFSWLPSGEITDCNQAFAQMLGFDTPSQLIGSSYWEFLADESCCELTQVMQRSEVNGRESSLKRRDGSVIYLLENTTFVESGNEAYYETTALDITQTRQSKLELQRARDTAQLEAENDPLTGLANRRRFSHLINMQLEIASAYRQSFALLYLDLDGFKAVNDTLGHVVGDLLLQKVAARLSSQMLPGDTLCRIGGDEFAILLTSPQSVAAPKAVAATVLQALDHAINVGEQEITIGASIGISLYPELASDYTTLLQQADGAMYVAKRAGKNRAVIYSHEIGTAEHEKNQILSELKGAIARKEISVHYQPEFDVQGNCLVRFETLARWQNRILGSVSPEKFIPIAEENGIILELGAHILEVACRDAAAWQRRTGRATPIAVNISTAQLRSETFVDDVLEIIRRTGLSPELVELEMTESIMLDDAGRSREMLSRLQANGVGLALDDFGTGYSCLSYLRDLPFDRLKVDRSFLRRAVAGSGGEALINAVVSVAHALDMAVVLEGIETAYDLEFASKLGVDEVQGFLLGRPCADPLPIILGQLVKEAATSPLRHQHTRCSRSHIRRDRLTR